MSIERPWSVLLTEGRVNALESLAFGAPVLPRDDGDGRRPLGHLPIIRINGLENDPVIELRSISGELIYSRRMQGQEHRLPVFNSGPHLVRVGDPDQAHWLELTVQQDAHSDGPLFFDFTQRD